MYTACLLGLVHTGQACISCTCLPSAYINSTFVNQVLGLVLEFAAKVHGVGSGINRLFSHTSKDLAAHARLWRASVFSQKFGQRLAQPLAQQLSQRVNGITQAGLTIHHPFRFKPPWHTLSYSILYIVSRFSQNIRGMMFLTQKVSTAMAASEVMLRSVFVHELRQV